MHFLQVSQNNFLFTIFILQHGYSNSLHCNASRSHIRISCGIFQFGRQQQHNMRNYVRCRPQKIEFHTIKCHSGMRENSSEFAKICSMGSAKMEMRKGSELITPNLCLLSFSISVYFFLLRLCPPQYQSRRKSEKSWAITLECLKKESFM